MTEKADKQKPQVRSAVYTNTVEATPWSIKLDTADPDIYNQKQSEIDKEFIAKNYKQSGESGLTDNLDSTLDNFGFIVKDLLAGDPKALERPEITCLNFDAIKAALQWLNEQNEFDNTMKADLFSNAWRLNFKCRPPTPEEFLTEKYIGPMSESLRPSLRDTFCEAFDPLKPYRTIILTPHIGWGKAQPYSSKIAVDEESVIDFTFDDGQVLTFNEEDFVFDGDKFIKAKEVNVDLPQLTNYLIMSIYDCRKISEFEKAFEIEKYGELIEFFKKIPKNFLLENDIKFHNHHILPKCEGGLDSEDNLVSLPVYFHIKAHYLRAKEFEIAGNKNFAFKHYQSVLYSLNENKIPETYKEFLKELDIVIESYEKQSKLEKSLKWMSKEGKSIRVFENEIENYKKQGWELKRVFSSPSGKIWVNDGKNNFLIKPEELKEGFIKGMIPTEKMKNYSHKTTGSSNMKWIKKGKETKYVHVEELDGYLENGWELGHNYSTGAQKGKPHKKQGMHWWTNGKENVQSVNCPAEGFRRGRVCK